MQKWMKIKIQKIFTNICKFLIELGCLLSIYAKRKPLSTNRIILTVAFFRSEMYE